MAERRFVLVDFTHTSCEGRLRLYEARCFYAMPRPVAHAAAKRELIATERPRHWWPPSIVRPPEILTEAEVVDAKNELQELQRHSLEVVHPTPRG